MPNPVLEQDVCITHTHTHKKKLRLRREFVAFISVLESEEEGGGSSSTPWNNPRGTARVWDLCWFGIKTKACDPMYSSLHAVLFISFLFFNYF